MRDGEAQWVRERVNVYYIYCILDEGMIRLFTMRRSHLFLCAVGGAVQFHKSDATHRSTTRSLPHLLPVLSPSPLSPPSPLQ